MKKDTIREGNKLIADFMNFNFLNKKEYAIQVGCPNDKLEQLPDCNCYYHSSWDWLIPVVHKILFNTNLNGTNSDDWENLVKNIQSALSNCEITNLFDTTVEFINWYNKK
jgi:hypothetical protein